MNNKKIVSQTHAALAFRVKERTIQNWLKSWGKPAKIEDEEGRRIAAKVDIEILYTLLIEAQPGKWEDHDYQAILDAELAGVPEVDKPESASETIRENFPKDKKGDFSSKTHISELPKDSDLLSQLEKMMDAKLRDIRVDHNTMVNTTDLAKRRDAKIQKFEEEIEEKNTAIEELKVQLEMVPKLEKRNRHLNYYYLLLIVILLSIAAGFLWYLDKTVAIKETVISGQSDTISEQGGKIAEQVEKLEQAASNYATLKTLKEATDKAKTQLESDLSLTQKERNDLIQKMQQLEDQIRATDAENILLMEENQKLRIQKSESTDAEPNSVNITEGK